MKSIQQYDADKAPENPKSTTGETQPETPLDLGFPDDEDANNDCKINYAVFIHLLVHCISSMLVESWTQLLARIIIYS